VAVEGSPPDALGVAWLPSTAVGDGEAPVAVGGGDEPGADAGGPGVEGEDATLGDGEEDGAPERAAGGDGDTVGDCEAVSVAPGDGVSETGDGLDVA
jgi:hypothetical protein